VPAQPQLRAPPQIQVIELKPSAGEQDCRFEWEQGMLRAPAGRDPEAGIPQPALQFTREGATNFARQKFAGGGDHTAAWTDVARPDGSRLILASVGFNPQSEGDAGKQEATDQLKQAQSTGLEQLTTTHRQWWHGFYPASFLSIPDTRLESFYWIQLYKMASATRADRPMLDLMGPWFRTSPWLRPAGSRLGNGNTISSSGKASRWC
jgi:hypothetical protein